MWFGAARRSERAALERRARIARSFRHYEPVAVIGRTYRNAGGARYYPRAAAYAEVGRRAGAVTSEDDLPPALGADPDDRQTRLVFADWLEDRGDERGPGYRSSTRAVTTSPRSPA
jgi:uncharacterized protein (TIGR02996 family)